MTAAIIEFPQARVRASGELSPDRRAHCLARFREIAKDLRRCDTGELVDEAERERFACGMLESIEKARAELLRKK